MKYSSFLGVDLEPSVLDLYTLLHEIKGDYDDSEYTNKILEFYQDKCERVVEALDLNKVATFNVKLEKISDIDIFFDNMNCITEASDAVIKKYNSGFDVTCIKVDVKTQFDMTSKTTGAYFNSLERALDNLPKEITRASKYCINHPLSMVLCKSNKSFDLSSSILNSIRDYAVYHNDKGYNLDINGNICEYILKGKSSLSNPEEYALKQASINDNEIVIIKSSDVLQCYKKHLRSKMKSIMKARSKEKLIKTVLFTIALIFYIGMFIAGMIYVPKLAMMAVPEAGSMLHNFLNDIIATLVWSVFMAVIYFLASKTSVDNITEIRKLVCIPRFLSTALCIYLGFFFVPEGSFLEVHSFLVPYRVIAVCCTAMAISVDINHFTNRCIDYRNNDEVLIFMIFTRSRLGKGRILFSDINAVGPVIILIFMLATLYLFGVFFAWIITIIFVILAAFYTFITTFPIFWENHR